MPEKLEQKPEVEEEENFEKGLERLKNLIDSQISEIGSAVITLESGPDNNRTRIISELEKLYNKKDIFRIRASDYLGEYVENEDNQVMMYDDKALKKIELLKEDIEKAKSSDVKIIIIE